MHQPKKIPSPGAYLYLYTQPNLIDAGKTQARSSAVVHATASNKRLRSFQTCNNFGQLKKGNFVLSWAQYSAIRSNWLGDGLAHVKLVAFFVEFSFFFKLKKTCNYTLKWLIFISCCGRQLTIFCVCDSLDVALLPDLPKRLLTN